MMSPFSPGNNSKKPSAASFSYGRYSVLSGVFGLLLSMLFFPGGIYPAFFLGVVGSACAAVHHRLTKERCLLGFILCGLSVLLSIFLFMSLLSFYTALRDPVMGPRVSQLFFEFTKELSVSSEEMLRVMRP